MRSVVTGATYGFMLAAATAEDIDAMRADSAGEVAEGDGRWDSAHTIEPITASESHILPIVKIKKSRRSSGF